MQFTVKKSDLLSELQLVQGVVEKKATIPILANLLLRGTRQGLEIVATDMELGIQSACDADVESEGAVTIHARRLHDIVRSLPDADIKVAVQKGNRVQIKCANAEFKIAGQGIEDYPILKEYDFMGSVAIPLDFYRGMIERVIFAITQDDPRYAIYGALMVIRKGSIEMVATDGHRLAYIKREADVAPREEIKVIVPSKALAEILKLEPGPEGEIRIGVKDNHIFFKSGLRILNCTLFDGTFPNYEKVMPPENDKILKCDTDGLLAALRRVSILSSERAKSVKMSIKDGKMVISTSNPEFGEAEETVEVDGYKGKEIEIGFNARYLIDFLQAVGAEQVQLELKDGETQGLLRPAGADGMDYRYVIMPMRI